MKLSKRIQQQRNDAHARALILQQRASQLDLGRPRVILPLLLGVGFLGGVACQRMGTKASLLWLHRFGMFL